MNRTTTLKRTAFRSRAQNREPRDPDRVRPTPTVTPGAFRAPQSVVAAPVAAPKAEFIRSKAYLRLVAQLPCKHCGIWGHSQAAHSNQGKGMGTKACDLQTFPLCADRPGQRGCHSYFDSGALFSKEQRRLHEIRWVAETQAVLLERAAVPKKFVQLMEQCHA